MRGYWRIKLGMGGHFRGETSGIRGALGGALAIGEDGEPIDRKRKYQFKLAL